MATHRYWRIKITADSGWGSSGGSSIAGIEMAATQGGANLCTGGTALASGNSGASWVPAHCFDGNDSTAWDHEPGSYANLYVGYDFGVGVAVEINEVRMLPRLSQFGGKPFTLRCPGAFTMQSSDDGSAWSDEWAVTYPAGTALNRHGYSAGAFIHFTRPSAYVAPGRKRWRVKALTSNGGLTTSPIAIHEMEMAATPGGTDLCTGGTAFGDSAWESGVPLMPANAFDGLTGTGQPWIAEFSAGYPMPKWLGYAFAGVEDVQSIKVWPRVGFATSQSPVSVVVQSSENTITWTDEWSGSFGTWSEGVPQTLTNPAYVAPSGRRRHAALLI